MGLVHADCAESVPTDTSERVLREWTDDFTRFASYSYIPVSVSGIFESVGGVLGTFRVRVGGTPGNLDGQVGAQVANDVSGPLQLQAAGRVATPDGQALIQLTGFVSDASKRVSVRGIVVRIG